MKGLPSANNLNRIQLNKLNPADEKKCISTLFIILF